MDKGRDEVTVADMIGAISPDAVAIDVAPSRTASPGVLATFKDFETSYCGPFDFSINEGEIVGIYGMLGSGRTNLLETMAGRGARGRAPCRDWRRTSLPTSRPAKR